MISAELALGVAMISLLVNGALLFKVIQLKNELSSIKSSTKLTREEVQKLNERIGRIKGVWIKEYNKLYGIYNIYIHINILFF